jgi:isoleucyl-tRNA synthetase
MGLISKEIQNFSQEQISELDKNGSLDVAISGKSITLTSADVEISSQDIPGWLVANAGGITVALDITLTDELKNEGIARELVNRIQKIRKETGLELTDRIAVQVEEYETLKSAIINFSDYICTEILADNIELVPQIQSGTEIEVNDVTLKVLISKN